MGQKKIESGASPSKICIELHYLPCIWFFSKFFIYEEIIIEVCEHYQKRSYRNRCHIAGANGLLRLSIPLKSGKNARQSIREVRISNHSNWRHVHWQSILSAYGKTPFFPHYAPELKHLLFEPQDFLFDFSLSMLNYCLRHVNGSTARLTLSTEYQEHQPPDTEDWRQRILPGADPHKDPAFPNRSYVQPFSGSNGYQPNMSILDLLFCTGPEAPLYLKLP